MAGRIKGWPLIANSRSVSDKSDGFRGIEISDMVGSVARRVEHLKLTRAQGEGFATFKRVKIRSGNGQELAKEPFHVVAI